MKADANLDSSIAKHIAEGAMMQVCWHKQCYSSPSS